MREIEDGALICDRSIGRSFTISTAIGHRLDPEAGELTDYVVDFVGDYTPARAQKQLRRETGDDTIVICKVEQSTDYYSMSVVKFLENAVKLETN